MSNTEKPRSYIAGGREVTLEPDPKYVAINLRLVGESHIDRLQSLLAGSWQRVSPTLAIVSRKALEALGSDEGVSAGAVFPVFVEGGTRIIPQPEVRVESNGRGQSDGMKRVRTWLDQHPGRAQLVSSKPQCMVLAPQSGYAPDAVTLARDIAKSFNSLSASPRFLRVVPKPVADSE
jgi:hypothetical protein